MNTKEIGQKLVFLGILFLVVFSYPFITVANKMALVLGFPVLYLFIFIAWSIAIILILMVADAKQRRQRDE